MAIESRNPATGELLEQFAELDDRALEAALQRADDAAHRHARTPFSQRAAWLAAAARILEDERERWGETMVREMGKLRSAAIAEVDKCAWVCRYYAEHGERMLADRAVDTDATHSFIRYQPLGAVLAVMPWNFPFWQVFRFAAPALMAGNVGLLKHASNVPRCARGIEEILRRAGFPEGTFQNLFLSSDRTGAVIDDARVKAVTLTGSEGAGSAVAERAGRNIKKSVLELGGSDPFIVMPSADLDDAIDTAVKARMINNGQSCIAAKRFIVHRDIAPRFIDRFVARIEALDVGDPMKEGTDIGPLATESIRDELAEQVERSVAAGAKLLTGGRKLEGKGWFYQPTVLADIPAKAPAARDELFGPVASVFVADDVEDAIRIANATSFGLGSSAWTHDEDEQARFVDGLAAGMVFINSMVASDPRLPFGGIRRSGYGRELGDIGITEFVNIKTVSVK